MIKQFEGASALVSGGAGGLGEATVRRLHADGLGVVIADLDADKGKALAKSFGDSLRAIGVPVGKVYTSLFNRAYETAVLAGFPDIEKTADLTEGGLVVSPNENNRRAEAFRKLLGAAPKAGTDTVIVTHKPNIVDALGKDWFDVKEGEASIFRPETGKYVLVARLQMADWPHVAAAAKQ